MQKKYLPRLIDAELHFYLSTFGAVLIRGAKWCGKTTTAERQTKSILRLQNPERLKEYRRIADVDPALLLSGEKPLLIDEWQMIPELWDTVRLLVDEAQDTGMFVLTGSTVLHDAVTMHPGIGRIGRLTMRPMSLYESHESNGSISLRELFDGNADIGGQNSLVSIQDIAGAVCRGGWPASLSLSEAGAMRIAQDYIWAICEDDTAKLDSFKHPRRIKNILASYARNISTTAANTTILQDIQSNDTQISEKTLYTYLNALHRLFVIEDVPAWNPSIRSKTAIRSSVKKAFVDPSLAVASLGLSPSALLKDFQMFGFLFENLCIRDLRIYSSRLQGEASYYRDRYGLECDCVLHIQDGRYGLIEIKLGSSDIEKGASHLLKLRDLIKKHGMREPSFLLVLTGGKMAYRRKDDVMIIPIGCLKD